MVQTRKLNSGRADLLRGNQARSGKIFWKITFIGITLLDERLAERPRFGKRNPGKVLVQFEIKYGGVNKSGRGQRPRYDRAGVRFAYPLPDLF